MRRWVLHIFLAGMVLATSLTVHIAFVHIYWACLDVFLIGAILFWFYDEIGFPKTEKPESRNMINLKFFDIPARSALFIGVAFMSIALILTAIQFLIGLD